MFNVTFLTCATHVLTTLEFLVNLLKQVDCNQVDGIRMERLIKLGTIRNVTRVPTTEFRRAICYYRTTTCRPGGGSIRVANRQKTSRKKKKKICD